MIIINSYRYAGFDTDAQAFFTAAGITDATQKSAVNQLVLDLKGHSLWSKYLAIYPFVGGTSGTHAVNLKNPGTYNLTFTGGTHSANGTDWTTSQYATTNIPNSNINESNFYISIYCRENTDELGVFFGWDDTSISRHGGMFGKFGGQLYSDVINETEGRLQIATAFDTRGLFAASLTASRTHTAYRNGSSIGSKTNSSASAFSLGNILLNARTTTPDFAGTKQTAYFAVANSGFSSTEAGNEYTDVQAFQTTLGRNV